MSEKPRNKWFRGDKTSMEFEDNEIVLSRGCCSHNAGERGVIKEAPCTAFWSNQWEYAIVPLDDLNLDIEEPEPEPELVKVEGCTAPTVQESGAIPGWFASTLYGDRGVRVLLVFHPNKNVAIEAHNAAAEVLNKHGGV